MLGQFRYKLFSARHRLYIGALLASVIGLLVSFSVPIVAGLEKPPVRTPIKVGILHSLTGTMAVSEKTVAAATQLAIEELNDAGGVLGRPVEAILLDTKSDWPHSAKLAERLIRDNQVSAVFGCWTSACRKTVKAVFEQYDHMLFYPVQYEGLEASPNIVYTGAAPNQQIIPATKWSMDKLGHRIFLVGSDYVFPRTAHEIIRTQVQALGGQIVGDFYAPLGSGEFGPAIEAIKASQPDVIFNTINGDSNISFYRQLRAAGISAQQIPVMSFSLAEAEVRAIGADLVAGDYAARNYFQSMATQDNLAFVSKFRKRFGQKTVTTAPMEAAYFGVRMWAKAVEEAGSPDVSLYREALRGQSMSAPSGVVYIDPKTQHTWRTVLIGRMERSGNYKVVWSSIRPVRPVPFPSYLARTEWEDFLNDLFQHWGGNWAAPAKPKPKPSGQGGSH